MIDTTPVNIRIYSHNVCNAHGKGNSKSIKYDIFMKFHLTCVPFQKHCVRYHRAYENDAVGSSVYNNDPVPHLTTTQLTTCDDCNSSTVATTNEYQVYPLEWIMSNENRFPRRMKHLDIEFLWMIKDFMSKRSTKMTRFALNISPAFLFH